MNAPRIRQLLNEREQILADLYAAETREDATAARAELRLLAHSLWLAGYREEELCK